MDAFSSATFRPRWAPYPLQLCFPGPTRLGVHCGVLSRGWSRGGLGASGLCGLLHRTSGPRSLLAPNRAGFPGPRAPADRDGAAALSQDETQRDVPSSRARRTAAGPGDLAHPPVFVESPAAPEKGTGRPAGGGGRRYRGSSARVPRTAPTLKRRPGRGPGTKAPCARLPGGGREALYGALPPTPLRPSAPLKRQVPDLPPLPSFPLSCSAPAGVGEAPAWVGARESLAGSGSPPLLTPDARGASALPASSEPWRR